MTSTLEEQLQEELDSGRDENDFVVKNLRRQIEAKKSEKDFAEFYITGFVNKPTSENKTKK